MSIGLAIVEQTHAGMRLDLFLTNHFSGTEEIRRLSRSEIQRMITEGRVTLNGRKSKTGARLKSGDLIEIRWLPPRETEVMAEPIPLEILHEDEDCIVVNKAAGMVVHPAAGRRNRTLVNALLYHCPNLQGIGGERRPGIVHRLDRDTSGVMVVARHDQAFHRLALQFKQRRVHKEYLALVWGRMDKEKGIIDRPIGRHRADRKRMSSLYSLSRSREATTEWEVEESFRVGPSGDRFSWVTLLRLKPLSGRTHQIRVHLADEGHPVVGDRMYGPKRSGFVGMHPKVTALMDLPRQALHAERLGFSHPRTGKAVQFDAPLPPDMQQLLDSLRVRHGNGEEQSVKGC